METLPPEIIINNILKLTFPNTSNLFLISVNFLDLQEKYYEQLGCTDIGSKNFIHALINVNKIKSYMFGEYVYEEYLGFSFDIIKFANDALTELMNQYLESMAILVKQTKTYYQYNFVKNSKWLIQNNLSPIKMQLIFLIADNSIKKQSSNMQISIDRSNNIVNLLKYNNNDIITFENFHYKYMKEYDIAKEIVEFSVNIINLYYSMVGIKLSYSTSNKYIEYRKCWNCGREYININNTCECRRGFNIVTHREFYAELRSNLGSANYFYYPNWYNKIYTNIKCIDK